MNNSYVKVKAIEESEDGTLSATFVTLEGHVEKGEIKFSFSQDEEGNIKFDINSISEPDWGSAPDAVSREAQKGSWFEVLDNIANGNVPECLVALKKRNKMVLSMFRNMQKQKLQHVKHH